MTSGNSLSTAGLTKLAAMLIVGVIVIAAVLAPMLNDLTRETIVEDYNSSDDASWIRMNYGTADYDLEYTLADNTITVGNQSGTADDMILYADEKSCVMSDDGKFIIVNGYTENPEVIKADTVTVTRTGENITITDGTNTIVSTDAPAWAYYPKSDGTYSFFNASVEGVKVKPTENLASAGSFAGVYTYNNIVVAPNGYGDLGGMELNATVTDGVIDSITWERATKDLEITSSLPVNTSYWESTTYAGSPAVKYIGPASDLIVVPTQFNGSRINHMTTLTSDNIASDGATVVWGFVAQPNAKDLNVNGTAVFGRGITFPSLAFNNTSVDSLVFSKTFNYAGSGANIFAGANVKEVLNLGSTDITPSIKSLIGLTNATIKDHVDALGYIAPLSYTKVVEKEGTAYDILLMMPVLLVIALLIPIADYFVGDKVRSRIR